MFAFFRKPSRSTSSRRQPRRRFRLESLESRVCPTTLGVDLWAETADASNVVVQGSIDGDASKYTVVLGGEVSGSLTTDSGGFSYFGPAGGLGTVTATVTDSNGDSGQGSTDIEDETPGVESLMASATGDGKQVEISGSVSAVSPGGLTVNFSGSAGLGATSTTTDAEGNFDLITTASKLGEVNATVTDTWGVTSPTTTTDVMATPPQIMALTVQATGQGKQVEVSGGISASTLGGLTVTFSGPAGLADTSATTDDEGDFDLITTASKLGEVDAVVNDVWGQTSPVAATTLSVMAPQITDLEAANLGGGEWKFTGTVSGPDTSDDTVQLSGIESGSATPDSSGNFSVVIYLGSNTPIGDEYAVATDIWGQTSSQFTYSFVG